MELNRNMSNLLRVLLLAVIVSSGPWQHVAAQSNSADTTDSAVAQYKGVDISHYQGDIDWAALSTTGIKFVFIKATEADTDVDPKFAANWAGAGSTKLVRGAYHFFDPDVDALSQANHFIATVRLEPGDLPPALDIEVQEGITTQKIDADIELWLEKVAQAYGVRPIVYSDVSFIEKNLASGFGKYPLWIADYSNSAPAAPGDWASWTIWQHSQSGKLDGIDGAVDLDVYQGSETTWQQLLVPESK